MEISEKEFAVIREISNNHLPDQRTIASKTGISLGLTNLIIKRLISKGYIKAKQLNRNKIQYMLMPKGFAEKAKKSYAYTLKTINLLTLFREKIQAFALDETKKGAKEFVLSGNNQLVDIAELAFKAAGDQHVTYSRCTADISDQNATVTVVYDTGKQNTVDIIKYVAESGMFNWQ